MIQYKVLILEEKNISHAFLPLFVKFSYSYKKYNDFGKFDKIIPKSWHFSNQKLKFLKRGKQGTGNILLYSVVSASTVLVSFHSKFVFFLNKYETSIFSNVPKSDMLA